MMELRTGNVTVATESFGEAMDIPLLDGFVGLSLLLDKAAFGFGFRFCGGLVLLLGPGARFRGRLRRSPTGSHANKFDGASPFDDVPKRLGEDVCTLGFGACVGHAEDFAFPEIVQP